MAEGQPHDAEKRYDVFISYSHAANSGTAARLQRALQSIAKPWYRLRSMRVFRDETDLSAAPELWPTIQAALAQSRYFLLMASERAAGSRWVAKELAYWLEHRSSATLLIALTDGDVVWDDERGDFDWRRTTALPRRIAGAFQSEPLWVDLRWTNAHQNLTLRNPEFLRAAARLAAPVQAGARGAGQRGPQAASADPARGLRRRGGVANIPARRRVAVSVEPGGGRPRA